jgi:hypothetical protein
METSVTSITWLSPGAEKGEGLSADSIQSVKVAY